MPATSTTGIGRIRTENDLLRWLRMVLQEPGIVPRRQTGVLAGSGSPEGVVEAPVGHIYRRTDGGAGTTLYVKESGTGDTGWVAK